MRTLISRVLTAIALSLALVAVVAPVPASAGDPAYGRLWRKDGVLRPGCHNYYFHYRLKQAGDEWAFEVTLKDRRGRRIADALLTSSSEPKRGRNHVRFCRANTVPGRFKFTGHLRVQTGYDFSYHWVEPAKFHLRRP